MRIQTRIIYLLALLLALPLPASAEGELLMGVFPRRNATLTSQLFSPLADYLSQQLNREVKLETAKDFPSFWEGVVAGRYDIVHYNQYHYIQSADKYAVIVCNEEGGTDSIAGALYVRRDSGITEVEQLRGKRIIFGGGIDAMMSHIVPNYILRQAGLGEGDYQAIFASNPLNAVLAVHFRQADAGGAGDIVMNLPKIKKITEEDTLTYLATSEPIKHLPWTVRRDMDKSLRERIRTLLIGLDTTERGRDILRAARLTGMNAVTDSDYDTARTIIREVMPDQQM